ncbi:MAG: hypothetical protein RL660_2378 [Bacteroidota bacterium]|jgi:hypothetical protein
MSRFKKLRIKYFLLATKMVIVLGIYYYCTYDFLCLLSLRYIDFKTQGKMTFFDMPGNSSDVFTKYLESQKIDFYRPKGTGTVLVNK